jgi:hypothetical protein
MLKALQKGLEALYRVDTDLDVEAFVIDAEARRALGPGRSPREQLLVSERDGDLELALYLDAKVLENLASNDPRQALGPHNLGDFLLAIEGVSHFVYVAWCARQERTVSALELELQAEVDKYATCLLTAPVATEGKAGGEDWPTRLFERFHLLPDLDDGERERYLVANENARRYTGTLQSRYVDARRWDGLYAELRRFYRLGIGEKLERIRAA